MCSWGQGDDDKGCAEPLVTDDAPYQQGDNCYAQGGACMSIDIACPASQQIASDCYSTEVCCLPPFDASPDASPDQESEASSDARSDADASLADGFGDGPAEATEVDAASEEATDAGPEASGD